MGSAEIPISLKEDEGLSEKIPQNTPQQQPHRVL